MYTKQMMLRWNMSQSQSVHWILTIGHLPRFLKHLRYYLIIIWLQYLLVFIFFLCSSLITVQAKPCNVHSAKDYIY